MMRVLRGRRAVWTGLLALVAGCGRANYGATPHRPAVQLVLDALDVEQPDEGQARVRAQLSVHNPSREPVQLDTVHLAFVLNGTLLGRTTRRPNVPIRAGATETVEIVLPFRPSAATRALVDQATPRRGVGYRLDGEAWLAGGPADRQPFAFEGRWPLAEA